MIRIGPGLYVFGIAALTACGSKSTTETATTSTGWTGTTSAGTPAGSTSPVGTTFSVTGEWTDDGFTPTDTDGDGILDSGCGDSLDIQINDPLGTTDWSFGMALPGVNGWTGEDCITGLGTFNYCHSIGATHTLNEVTDCREESVVEGVSTYLDASSQGQVSFVLIDPTGWCVAFGADPAYYSTLGCADLPEETP